ncbi:MAG: hypothetical protein HKN43_11355 [Rhodothermales bacterium]|nr:hypothetical protein [Rhodothermales bacterium]
MKITSKEYQQVVEYVKKLPITTRFNAADRMALQKLTSTGYDLATLEDSMLRRLVELLPSGRVQHVASPYLHSVRQKGKQTLVFRARPHLNPDHWPKIYRKINNNDRAGLRAFGGGQLGVLNDKATSIPLRGSIVWNESKFGELIIMGPWSVVSATIAAAGQGLSLEFGFGDIYAGDVNVEFDRMYTDEKTPADDRGFVVSCMPGSAFSATDEEGEVVLDARGALVDATGGAVAGLAGGGVQLSGGLEIAGVVKDSIELAANMSEKLGVKLKASNTNKDMFTFVVSLFPVGDYPHHKTGKQKLSGSELLQICKQLANMP